MISSLWLNKTDKFLLACDGKEFFVYGDSPIANSIRGHTERGTGAFASFLKKPKKTQKTILTLSHIGTNLLKILLSKNRLRLLVKKH